MSGATIDKKVRNAFKKVGNLTGFSFDHYRASDMLIPMRDANLVGSWKTGFSQDEQFTQTPDDTLKYYKLYMDYGALAVNDILYSNEVPATFVVLQNTKIRGAVGVLCTHFVDVHRPRSTPTADKKITLDEIGRSVPCAVEYVAGAAESGAMSNVPSSLKTGSSNVKVWFGLNQGDILINDVLKVDGCSFRVKSVTFANGLKVVAESVKAGV